MLFASLRSTNKSAISCFFSHSLSLVLFSPPCSLLHLSFYLKLCGRSGRNCLLSSLVLSCYNGSLDTHFSWGMMLLMSYPNRDCYLHPLQSLIFSLLFIGCIHSCLISDWRRTVSSKFFDTQISLISTKELVLPHHACCVLSRLCCNRNSLLLSSYFCRIGIIENLSCSTCRHSSQDTSHLILHCPATTLCTAHFLEKVR